MMGEAEYINLNTGRDKVRKSAPPNNSYMSMVALSSWVSLATLMFNMEKMEYNAAHNNPSAIPSLYLMSMLKMNKMPAMAMKLSRMSLYRKRLPLMSGSNRVVKKQEVATQATPIETFDTWILAKNATQCKASNTPHPHIFNTPTNEVL